MPRKARFKGGPIWLNSGGQGPDDYLLKPVEGGRWTYVIFRWGRNFRWSPEGNIEDTETAQANVKADKAALDKIMPIKQICVPDNATRYRKMKERGSVPTMSAAEFWEKYKDKPVVRYWRPGW